MHFNTVGNVHFSKGVNPWFWPIIGNFFLSCFSLKKGLYIIFDDVPERNEVFLDLKNVILGYSKKQFSKEFGQIFFGFVFLRKRLDDVPDRKDGF